MKVYKTNLYFTNVGFVSADYSTDAQQVAENIGSIYVYKDGEDYKEVTSDISIPVYIKADSRYMYRVLENMYSNISKYAMENTRVYIDVLPNNNKVTIQMKNISKEKLNISTDELMQRFVRGDSSRNTEGSGLGLSIATSLTTLQGGTFNIYLDGDLFKVIIEFNREIN